MSNQTTNILLHRDSLWPSISPTIIIKEIDRRTYRNPALLICNVLIINFISDYCIPKRGIDFNLKLVHGCLWGINAPHHAYPRSSHLHHITMFDYQDPECTCDSCKCGDACTCGK